MRAGSKQTSSSSSLLLVPKVSQEKSARRTDGGPRRASPDSFVLYAGGCASDVNIVVEHDLISHILLNHFYAPYSF